MTSVDYLNVLGAGASFNTKEIVSALVEAEEAPQRSRIDGKIENSEASISGLSKAKAQLTSLRNAALAINDKNDFDSFTTSNDQSSNLTVLAEPGAKAGAHTVNVSSVARGQTLNVMKTGDAVFSSQTELLNGGVAFDIVIQIGGASGVSHTINVVTDTPQGIADAITSADIGVDANLLDTGTTGTSYVLQLTGQQGSANSFTLTENSTSIFSSSIPSGFSAADASLTVNGLAFTRPTNSITDVIPGVVLNLNSTTSTAANISVTRDTSGVEDKIRLMVTEFNATKAELDSLVSAEDDGPLKGDSIAKRVVSDVRNILLSISSSAGSNYGRLSDLGISINKVGTFDIDETKFSDRLSANFEDVRLAITADTNNQTETGTASRGIAGDLSKLISDLTSSTGYFSTRPRTLEQDIVDYKMELSELESSMEKLRERYEKQFLNMQSLINELNNTKDNLISSFDNLPFSNRD